MTNTLKSLRLSNKSFVMLAKVSLLLLKPKAVDGIITHSVNTWIASGSF